MENLVATFEINLPGYMLVNQPEDKDLRYSVRIEEFEVEFKLERSWTTGSQEPYEKNMSRVLSRGLVSVAREEHELPPSVKTSPSGQRDHTIQAPYFEKRLRAYQPIALIVVNRIIRYFKYSLHNALLHELSPLDQDFQNPKWTDERGTEAGTAAGVIMAQPIPGLHLFPFGAKKFTEDDELSLIEAIERPSEVQLYEEFLSDAQSSFFEDNLKRGVLEMAIACEVAVKRAFFSKATAAGYTFEWLEDRGRIRISLPELIDGVAKDAFGESFKDANTQAYTQIVFLFRCRNKVVHRGELAYRDEAATTHTVNPELIEKWWTSVEELMVWLKSKSN